MSNLKFPDAAVIKSSLFLGHITAEQLAYIQNNYVGIYEKDYRNYLYCPECHKAKLFFRNGTEKAPHFYESSTSFHDKGCSKNYKAVSQATLKSIYINNPKDIEMPNILNKVIALFYRGSVSSVSPFIIPPKSKISSTSTKSTTKTTTKKSAIPHKLVTHLSFNDLSEFKIFYGDVYIKWEKKWNKKNNKPFWNLRLYKEYDEDIKKFRHLCCSLSISEAVYNYIKTHNIYYLDNQHCYIAFFSKIEQTYRNGHYYNNSALKHSDFLDIETLKIIR